MKSAIYSHVVRLDDKKYQDILNLVYDANRCEDMNSFVDTVCFPMTEIFHTDCITFHLIKGYPQHVSISEARSFKRDRCNLIEDKHYPAIYRHGYYRHSPFLKEAISSLKPALKIKEDITQKDWERSDMYNDFIRPQHLYWELFLPLRWQNNLKGMITLLRPRNQPDFESSDTMKGEILAPHLVLAIHNINQISKINHWWKNPAQTNDTNDEGLILFDQKIRPIYSNVKAREICLYMFNNMASDAFNAETGEFPIPSWIIKDCYDLLGLLNAGETLARLSRERVIFLKNGKKFHVQCSLIQKIDHAVTVSQFVVTLSDLSCENMLEPNLQEKFHLTRREADIIYCIMAEMSCGEIAEKLYISKLTVHTHIKNIYRKLGINNKIELFKCVQSPSWLVMPSPK